MYLIMIHCLHVMTSNWTDHWMNVGITRYDTDQVWHLLQEGFARVVDVANSSIYSRMFLCEKQHR